MRANMLQELALEMEAEQKGNCVVREEFVVGREV